MRFLNGRLVLSPSDLNDYVECPHLTGLSLEVALGSHPRPHVASEQNELLRRKGQEHEAAYLAQLRRQGRDVVEIVAPDPWDFEADAHATMEAMRAGAEIIYQATFVDGDWRGRADFLERVDRPTALGAWGYEPLDAKLARGEKPTYVVQLCFYGEAIGRLQGVAPEQMHVLLGIGERRTLRYADFAAYYRRLRRGFEAAVARPDATEPYRVEHCALCEFREVCDERWRAEDHLVLVAGMRRDQVPRLRSAGLPTLASLAAAAPTIGIERMAARTFETLRDQAGLQLARRATGRLEWHPLAAEPGCGFELLPRPSTGDVMFDIEGDPFWEPARGLHFLFGLLVADAEQVAYRPAWAHTREQERSSFEALVDLLHERLARYPDMHVYHYGAYEPSAITQLMGVYGTREDAVDELLRRAIFVDLHRIVRQGLRAGVPGYSLKEVEQLAGFQRSAAVQSGTLAVLQYERWMESRERERLEAIAAYNEEDCRATLALRDWLLSQRPEATPWPQTVAPTEVDENRLAADREREALRQALTAGTTSGSPQWLAGELLEYHRREARPAWWWFFERRDRMSADDLAADAESIGKLEPTGEPPIRIKQSLVHRLRFPAQQHKLAPGDTPVDPATKGPGGTVHEVDDVAGVLTLRRGPSLQRVPLPKALIPARPYDTSEQRAALSRLASCIRAGGTGYPALRDILGRARPRLVGSARRDVIQTTDPDEVRELAASLDGSYLFIQGPPGTGKTWMGARIVVELMRRGRRVGVAATSHKAIHNLLDEIERAAADEDFTFRGLKKASKSAGESLYAGRFIASSLETRMAPFVDAGREVLLFAGTAWLFAHRDLDGERPGGPLVDTLVIDEAGQVALADALAMGTSARNVVLLGDPLQLAQVSQGMHPPGTEKSVLEHLLGEHATVPTDMGVFLERTRRMHPDVCRFISEVVYDGRLAGTPEVARQTTGRGTGLRYLPVPHPGNTTISSEEAVRVAAEIRGMLGASWTNARGETRALAEGDFMVVAPYNAQVRRLRQALGEARLAGVPVGTVDKFQGREAAVVFYSMATSSAEDIPRSLEFLFSRNRLNVAISRAMCLAYVVASPRLLDVACRTVEQMRMVNGLCRLVEVAG